MAACNVEINSLPGITGCPPDSTKVLLIGVPSLVSLNNPGGYGLITWIDLVNCIVGEKEPLRLIVGEDGAPEDGSSIWQNDSLKGLGGENGRIQIFIDNAPLTNYGATKAFDFDPVTGTIDWGTNDFYAGMNVYVNLNQ